MIVQFKYRKPVHYAGPYFVQAPSLSAVVKIPLPFLCMIPGCTVFLAAPLQVAPGGPQTVTPVAAIGSASLEHFQIHTVIDTPGVAAGSSTIGIFASKQFATPAPAPVIGGIGGQFSSQMAQPGAAAALPTVGASLPFLHVNPAAAVGVGIDGNQTERFVYISDAAPASANAGDYIQARTILLTPAVGQTAIGPFVAGVGTVVQPQSPTAAASMTDAQIHIIVDTPTSAAASAVSQAGTFPLSATPGSAPADAVVGDSVLPIRIVPSAATATASTGGFQAFGGQISPIILEVPVEYRSLVTVQAQYSAILTIELNAPRTITVPSDIG